MTSNTSSKSFQLTPEQAALSEKRKAKRQMTAAFSQQSTHLDSGKIIERPWISIASPSAELREQQHIKVFTWNLSLHKLLAQCLVRRELFPTSNCLKASQREHMLFNELLAAQADVLCLQEVDRLEKLLPTLEKEGYAYHYAAGPGKNHGCLVAYKKHLYEITSTQTVHYDSEEIRSDVDERTRCGKTFRTKNIASLVSLQSKSKGISRGVVVATTHLFWHPKYTYERTRQAAILIRETARFRTNLGLEHWPCIISGDFNFAPDDAAYSLIVGDTLLPEQEQALLASYVVHVSVDSTVARTQKAEPEKGDEEAVDPDRVITSARPASAADGLLSLVELKHLFSQLPRLRSAYDVGLSRLRGSGGVETFSNRSTLGLSRRGRYEPMYTSYTHYWKTVLDYIFVLDPVGQALVVTDLLSPHKTSDLNPGLPQMGVSSSDHVSLAAKLYWQTAIKAINL